jgi:uncharacterized protein (UPF0216 family)
MSERGKPTLRQEVWESAMHERTASLAEAIERLTPAERRTLDEWLESDKPPVFREDREP